MSVCLTFNEVGIAATRQLSIDVRSLIIAGWTGRDASAVERHVRELEAIGVGRPTAVPMFYRVSRDSLTCVPHIQVAGRNSTGEVEFMLVAANGSLWIGLGSDHTDRELEKRSVTLSKQVCAKPIARSLWRFEEVADHWDELELRSYAHIRGKPCAYQGGAVDAISRPSDLIAEYCAAADLSGNALPDGTIMFCGTLPVHGEMEFARRFEIEIHDPRLDRTIRHGYDVEPLPLQD